MPYHLIPWGCRVSNPRRRVLDPRLISRVAPWPLTFEGRSTGWATVPRHLKENLVPENSADVAAFRPRWSFKAWRRFDSGRIYWKLKPRQKQSLRFDSFLRSWWELGAAFFSQDIFSSASRGTATSGLKQNRTTCVGIDVKSSHPTNWIVPHRNGSVHFRRMAIELKS